MHYNKFATKYRSKNFVIILFEFQNESIAKRHLTRKTARRHSLLDNIMEFLFLGGIFSSRRHPISLRRLLRSHILFIDLHNPFGSIMKYSPMKVVEICTELFSLMFLTCTQQVLLTVPTYIKLLKLILMSCSR